MQISRNDIGDLIIDWGPDSRPRYSRYNFAGSCGAPNPAPKTIDANGVTTSYIGRDDWVVIT